MVKKKKMDCGVALDPDRDPSTNMWRWNLSLLVDFGTALQNTASCHPFCPHHFSSGRPYVNWTKTEYIAQVKKEIREIKEKKLKLKFTHFSQICDIFQHNNLPTQQHTQQQLKIEPTYMFSQW